MASASSSSNAKNSRFSSFNVFKLSNKKNKSDAALPPPPPPKDPYYLHNRSLLSLSPDSLSLPNTPLSGPFQYQFPRKPSSQFLHPSSSSMSLVSSAASAVSYSPEVRPTLNNKKSGFFKFGRRSPRSPSVKSGVGTDETSTQSVEASDDGISQPWNFQVRFSFIHANTQAYILQHNVHVDDGCVAILLIICALSHTFQACRPTALMDDPACGRRSLGGRDRGHSTSTTKWSAFTSVTIPF